MTVAQTPSTSSEIQFVDAILPADVALDLPADVAVIAGKYPEHRRVTHKFVKDLLVVSPGMPEQQAGRTFSSIFQGVDRVKDEHFPQLGILAAGFLRALSLSVRPSVDNEPKPYIIEVDMYFRFTVDNCPAGTRLMTKATHEVAQGLNRDLNFPIENMKIHAFHGGTPHTPEDVLDETFRAYLKSLFCTPECADIKRNLLKNLPQGGGGVHLPVVNN